MIKQTNVLPEARLILNMQCPGLEECWVDGYESAIASMAEGENPFTKDSQENQQWLDGWWAGFYGEMPIYDLTNNADFAHCNEVVITEVITGEAVNESNWSSPKVKLWAGRVAKVAGIVAVTAAAMQLADLAA